MSVPAISEGRVFTFSEVVPDVTQIEVGDTVQEFATLDQYDSLVISLARLSLTRPDLTRPTTEPADPTEGTQLTPVPVRGSFGLNNKGVPRYHHWAPHVALPSRSIVPKGHHGSVENASVTLVGRDNEALADGPLLPRVDMLLSADLLARSRRISAHAAKLLTVRVGASGRWNTAYSDLPDNTADVTVRALHRQSRNQAYIADVLRLQDITLAGAAGSRKKPGRGGISYGNGYTD